jgi:TonB family protein
MFASGIALLLGGIPTFAQNKLDKVTGSGADENSPTKYRPHFPPLTQVGDMEVLSDAMGVDFGPYLRTGVLPYIRGTWQGSVRKRTDTLTSDRATLAVEFTILKDGSLDNMKLAESSGDTELDSTALDGLTTSAPFLALPPEFSGQFLQLRCHFYYKPGRIMQFEGGGVRGSPMKLSMPADAAETIFRGSNGATQPRPIYSPNPAYTEQARKAKVRGTVVLMVTVAPSGDVTDVKVVEGLGSGLDEKAIEAIRTWKFKPGVKDEIPVRTEIAVQVSFNLP